jgi:hypothetical protein
MAQSNGIPIPPPRGNKKYLKDDDLFVVTLNGTTYNVKWSDIKTLAFRPPSLWHIKDVSGGTCTARYVDAVFDLQGNRLSGPVLDYVINPGEEQIVVGNDVRFTDSTGNWNFGDQTRTKYQFQFDNLFNGCTNFNGDVQHLEVTEFAFDTSYMFNECNTFNQPVTHFNTKNVNTLRAMFQLAFEFNQPVNHFDTSNCENFMLVFQGDQGSNTLNKFNQPLDLWDTAKGTDFNSMFRMCEFNQDITGWNMSSAQTLKRMFMQTPNFNQEIGNWNVSNVESFYYTFARNSVFNKPLDNWSPESGTTFYSMFYQTTAFNQPIGSWNTKSAVDMDYIFYQASAFDQNISQWCVRTATNTQWNYQCPISAANSPVWGTCPRNEDG